MKIRGVIVMISFLFSCGNREAGIDTKVDKLKIQAFSLYERNEYAKAIPYFTALIGNDSSNGEYFFKRAYCLAWVGKKNQAIQDNLNAIRLNYRKDAAYYNIGLNYMFHNDSLAIYYFEKCIVENPKHLNAALQIVETKKRIHVQK